jgi:hypothetical protein
MAKVNGAAWSLSSYGNSKGELCVVEVVPGEGRGYGCNVAGPDALNASWGSSVSEFGPASSADGIIGPAKKTQPSAGCSAGAS